MTNHYFNGTLSLSDSPSDFNRMNYIVTDKVDGIQQSITDILDKVYSSNVCNKLIRVALRIYDNNHIINKMGSLHISRDKFKTESYHINGLPFELELFYLINRDIELVIEGYTDFSFAEDCVHNEDAKSFIS